MTTTTSRGLRGEATLEMVVLDYRYTSWALTLRHRRRFRHQRSFGFTWALLREVCVLVGWEVV